VFGASIEPRHVTNPIRFVLRHCSLSRAEVSKIHPDTPRVDAATRFYRTLDPSDLQVSLIHSGPHVLPELGEDLGRFTPRTLEQRGMVVLSNGRVTSVSSDYVRLKDGARLETQNVVCTIGNAPNPVLSELEAEYEEGKLLMDEWLRIKGHENVWAIGDGAANPDEFGQRCPPTAQFATPLGRQAANNIAAILIKAPLRPFRYKMCGQMATIGHHKGVCSIFGFRFSGFFAWWLTRTVPLLKLPGIDRQSPGRR
jgi:NADH:ubiquinone reductase (H+-translocating)